MVLTGEAQRTEELRRAYRVVAGHLRSLRPDGISVDHAQQVQDLASLPPVQGPGQVQAVGPKQAQEPGLAQQLRVCWGQGLAQQL